MTEQVAVTENVNETQTIAYTAFEQQTTEFPMSAPPWSTYQKSAQAPVKSWTIRWRLELVLQIVHYRRPGLALEGTELQAKTQTQTVSHVQRTPRKSEQKVSYTVQFSNGAYSDDSPVRNRSGRGIRRVHRSRTGVCLSRGAGSSLPMVPKLVR